MCKASCFIFVVIHTFQTDQLCELSSSIVDDTLAFEMKSTDLESQCERQSKPRYI